MSKPRLLDVLDTMIDAISAVCNASPVVGDYPGQTVAGWAVTTELTKILALGGNNYLTVLWPLKPSIGPIYSPNDPFCNYYDIPTSSLTATVTQQNQDTIGGGGGFDVSGAFDIAGFDIGETPIFEIDFEGTIGTTSQNVVTVLGNAAQCLVATTSDETTTDLATRVAAAINAAGVSTVFALAINQFVFVTGVQQLACNVGVVGSLTTEVDRITRAIQVITYAPSYMPRCQVDDAITQGLGTTETMWLELSDGQAMHVRRCGGHEQYVEKAQSSYSAFEAHTFFMVEYPTTVVTPVVQIGVVKLTEQVGDVLPPQTFYIG
jgi:hypothetical protein